MSTNDDDTEPPVTLEDLLGPTAGSPHVQPSLPGGPDQRRRAGGLAAAIRGYLTGRGAGRAAGTGREAGAERSAPGGRAAPARRAAAAGQRAVASLTAAAGRVLRTRRRRWTAGATAVLVVAGLVTGGVLLYRSSHRGTTITAYFTEAIGIYPGSDVRVLGVQVGTVDSVQPVGPDVRITMTIDHGITVPAGARALVVAPSVVADRYVQLTPAYTAGPRMVSGAVIPLRRTAVPIEIDQIYASLDKLANALGPAGANKQGALSDLIRTGAANMAGNGVYLHSMLTQFGGLSKTLGGSAGNLAATVTSLQKFTTMLKRNDGQVRQAERQLAAVSGFLASDRQQLAGALHELAIALGQVQGFIAANRSLIKSNVAKLALVTHVLVAERASLAQALDTAPLAADNLVAAYDATHRTLDGRGDLNELSMGPAALTLSGLPRAGIPGQGLPAGTVEVTMSERAALPPLPLPAVGPVFGTPQAILAGGRR
jgi:phospholipid/cholesterol/gamma-HCH transport system substrate-binding protein